MKSKIKYYSRLKRPNNEYLGNGYFKYESQLNKTFNLFLFSLCEAFNANRYRDGYVNIVLDVNPNTKEITKVKFIPQLLTSDDMECFRHDFKEYYGYDITKEIPVASAVELIERIAPTSTRYFSTKPNPKPIQEATEPLKSEQGEDEVAIRRGNESPVVRISKDVEGRERIEIGTTYDDYSSIFDGYLEDFVKLIGRLPMARKYVADQTTKP